ncbi:enoyl-CoA hydratase/isomerase family protein [Chloroflexota bacterium]
MDFDTITFEKHKGIATITLNRPEKLNAMNYHMLDELKEAIEDIVNDENVRVLILTGAGRGFCSGADRGGQAERAAMRAAGQGVLKSRHEQVGPRPVDSFFYGMEKPTICAVNGAAVGIGLSFALACDVRIASENARFGALWSLRGLMPDGGATFHLPRLVGVARALELFYSNDIIDAREAERIGLVNRVVPHEQMMPAAMQLAEKIAKGAAVPMELTKRAVYKAYSNAIESQLDYERWGQSVCYATEDHKEAIQATIEKREPVFKGR